MAGRCGRAAQAGSFDDAAVFGEVVLYTIRGILPSEILGAPNSPDGRIVIDCNNSEPRGMTNPDEGVNERLLRTTSGFSVAAAGHSQQYRGEHG